MLSRPLPSRRASAIVLHAGRRPAAAVRRAGRPGGVSLDGQRAGHDRARPGPRGGSHDRVARGLAALTGPEFRHLFGGLLCVIDLDQDPLAAVVFGAAAMGVAVMRKNV